MKRFLLLSKDVVLVILGVAFIFLLFAFLPKVLTDHYLSPQTGAVTLASTTPTKVVFIPSYVSTPNPVKGIYMTSWTASNKSIRDNLVKLIDSTEINSVVIDIKDYTGKIIFPVPDNKELSAFGSVDVRVADLQDFIEELHKKEVYVIGRMAVFQDAYFVKHRPDLAVKNKKGDTVWKDYKGISWIDVGSREYWDYIVLLSKESRKIGFDEINFDYIRFPSDGNMQDISYPFSSTTPKAVVLRDFFEYLDLSLEDSGLTTSADLFGMTTTATDDMGIGQLLENTFPYFDYISPMVYPSHYPTSFMNFKEPEKHPYEVIKFAMQSAVDKANLASTSPEKLRPWLQDFGLKMTYGKEEVRAQIRALNDIGLSSWMLWSASNRYTNSALLPE